MATVKLTNIVKRFGTVEALRNVSLDIKDGSFVVFVGPSGCGKSTLLRSIAGLESVNDGTIMIGDTNVTDMEPADRQVSMVFQSYALYPHMTVRANMEFGMKVNGIPRPERSQRVEEAARILQLSSFLERKPAQLSGGQRQRVAIGRSIVRNPKVFLFDEPLSNLDAKLRVQMRIELESLHRELGATMIYVTHDQVEAMTMADWIVVLNEGRVEQVGSPMELYHSPNTEFVASFIGSPSINILDADSQLGRAAGPFNDAARIGIRPEHIQISDIGLKAEIRAKEQLGGECFLHVLTEDDAQVVIKTYGEDSHRLGEFIQITLPERRIHLFDANGRSIRDERVVV